MNQHLLTVLLVFLTAEGAEALKEPEICYVLDGILFVYGIVLTFLYCRLKLQQRKKARAEPSPIYEKVEGIYTGLSTRDQETYTTLELSKSKSTLPAPPPEEGQLVGSGSGS
ncbi:high affinity immunoglobulin epsilon receptor subunit gamma [Hemicordylus capensis]|uniref:high affinity immunoglobulin epsilon receptor subunit gamma n=1 Tax=Hemicordylus capensis TaxID=884348 RepID=UPI0023038A29|nr:high affinity immunoglobulin epsilon receptor subunit gamma [Hemicordylus capensis]